MARLDQFVRSEDGKGRYPIVVIDEKKSQIFSGIERFKDILKRKRNGRKIPAVFLMSYMTDITSGR